MCQASTTSRIIRSLITTPPLSSDCKASYTTAWGGCADIVQDGLSLWILAAPTTKCTAKAKKPHWAASGETEPFWFILCIFSSPALLISHRLIESTGRFTVGAADQQTAVIKNSRAATYVAFLDKKVQQELKIYKCIYSLSSAASAQNIWLFLTL